MYKLISNTKVVLKDEADKISRSVCREMHTETQEELKSPSKGIDI